MTENIIELLKEKKELFTEYKDVLLKILDCPSEEMMDYSENLEVLKNKIDKIDTEIKKVCSLMGEEGENILLDIKNKSNRKDLTENRKQIFDISQNIFNIIYGMNSLFDQIKYKANQNKDQAMKKINSLKNTGKGIKYLQAVDSRFEKGTFLNIKK